VKLFGSEREGVGSEREGVGSEREGVGSGGERRVSEREGFGIGVERVGSDREWFGIGVKGTGVGVKTIGSERKRLRSERLTHGPPCRPGEHRAGQAHPERMNQKPVDHDRKSLRAGRRCR
jgi:hypothetical protein